MPIMWILEGPPELVFVRIASLAVGAASSVLLVAALIQIA